MSSPPCACRRHTLDCSYCAKARTPTRTRSSSASRTDPGAYGGRACTPAVRRRPPNRAWLSGATERGRRFYPAPGKAGESKKREHVRKREEELIRHAPTHCLKQELERARGAEQQRRDHHSHRTPTAEHDDGYRDETAPRRHALRKRARLRQHERRAGDAAQRATDEQCDPTPARHVHARNPSRLQSFSDGANRQSRVRLLAKSGAPVGGAQGGARGAGSSGAGATGASAAVMVDEATDAAPGDEGVKV